MRRFSNAEIGIAGLQMVLGVLITASISLAQVAVSVDWNQVKRTVDPTSYGVNTSYGHQTNRSGDPGFVAGLKYAVGKPDGSTSIVRMHRQGLVGSWSPNGVWDANRIITALTPLVEAGLELQIDFDRAIGGNGMEIAVADAAELVRIVNVQGGLGVKYWEIYNEGGGNGTHIKNCSRAMKAIDPTIIVGGPGANNMDVNYLTDIVRDGLPDIDFVSFHEYATGSAFEAPDEQVFAAPQRIGDQIRQLRQSINQVSPDKYIPIQWNEYNFDWTWDRLDPRVRTNKGAVLFSMIMVAAIDNGADVTNIWNECETSFGFMSCDGSQLYPSADAFHLFNQYLHGEQVAATTSNSNQVIAYAVKTNTSFSLCLINRSASQQTVPVSFPGWTVPSAWQRHEVWQNGYTGVQAASGSQITGGIVLPDFSVTILTSSIDLSGPYMQLAPGVLNLDGEAGYAIPGETIDIANIGAGTLGTVSTHVNYTQGSSGWITPTHTGSGNAQQTALQFSSSLVAGTHAAQLVVSAAGAKPDSVVCTITAEIVGPDVTPPTLSIATGSGTTVMVEFSEPVEQSSAQNTANYAISGGVTVNAASLSNDFRTVTLTTSALSGTGNYTLTVNNVRDRAGSPNTIAPNSTIPIQIIDQMTRIRFYPRSGFTIRMQNGRFEGSNGTTTDGPWTLLHSITNPSSDWNEVTSFFVEEPRFRIIRYTSDGGFGNVAEIEIYHGPTKVSGTTFGTPGTWGGSDADYTKAWDGDIGTFFDCNQSNANTGIVIEGGATAGPHVEDAPGSENEIRITMLFGASAVTIPIHGIGGPDKISLEIYDLRGALILAIPALHVDKGLVRVALQGSGQESSALPQGQYVACVRSGGSKGMARFSVVR